MTIEDVSDVLRLHPEATSWLVRQGILATVTAEKGKRVLATSIDAFKARFIRCADLAKECGTSPKALAADLARCGVLPTFGPLQCRQTLFARSEVEFLQCQCETGPMRDRSRATQVVRQQSDLGLADGFDQDQVAGE